MVDNGAYAAPFLDTVCDTAPKRLTLDYRLFFAIDPAHPGIPFMRADETVATSVLSPANAQINLAL